MPTMSAIALLALFAATSPALAEDTPQEPTTPPSAEQSGVAVAQPDGRPHLKVVIEPNGTILVEDQPVAVRDLGARLDELAKSGGVVWYHRDPRREPHRNATKVLDMAMERSLSIRMYCDRGFTQVFDPTKPAC